MQQTDRVKHSLMSEAAGILWVSVGIGAGILAVGGGFLVAYMHDQRTLFREMAFLALLIGGLLGAGLAFMVATLFGEGRLAAKMEVLPLALLGAGVGFLFAGVSAYVTTSVRTHLYESRRSQARGKQTRPRRG